MVQRQRLPDLATVHHLETDRVTETEPLRSKRPEPAIDGGQAQVGVAPNYLVARVGADPVEELQPGRWAEQAGQQDVHLTEYQVRGDEGGIAAQRGLVSSHCDRMVRLAGAHRREPARGVEKERLAHSLALASSAR